MGGFKSHAGMCKFRHWLDKGTAYSAGRFLGCDTYLSNSPTATPKQNNAFHQILSGPLAKWVCYRNHRFTDFHKKNIIMCESISTDWRVMGNVFVSIICSIESSFTVGFCIWQEKENFAKIFLTSDIAFHTKGVYRHTRFLHSLVQASLGRHVFKWYRKTPFWKHITVTCIHRFHVIN